MAFTSGSSISSCALDVHLLPFRKKTRQTETGISSGRQAKVGKLDQRSQSSTCRPSHSQHRYDNFHKAITNSTSYLKHFVECNTPPQHAVPCGAGSQRSSASKQRVPLPTTPQRQPGAQVSAATQPGHHGGGRFKAPYNGGGRDFNTSSCHVSLCHVGLYLPTSPRHDVWHCVLPCPA